MKRLIPIIMVVTMALLSCLSFVGCSTKTIERKDDTAFVILQFSDIHLDNKDGYTKRTFRTLDTLVKMTNPDMIVFTGDVNYDSDKGTKDNMKCLKTLAEKLEGYKLPWTYTFGNHCPSGYATKAEMAEYLTTLEYCFFERGSAEVFGEGNHYYNISNPNGDIIQTLFFFDTSGEEGGGHKFEDSQIAWYEDSVKQIALTANGSETDVVPSIAFFHIPPWYMVETYAKANEETPEKTHDFFELRTKFKSIDNNKTVLYGWRGESECPAGERDEMVATMKALGSTKAIFIGHEHLNNYVIEDSDGFRMTYTNTFDHKWYIPTRGATLINIKTDGTYTQRSMYRKAIDNIWRITDEF